MITLYKFGPVGSVCDGSPFCVKVEAYLRLAGLPYETACGSQYLRTAPKGKLPYIEDSGKIIADSSFILAYLQQSYGDKLDSHLNHVDKAISHAFIKMIDEHLYWVLAHARWALDHNIKALNDLFFAGIPFPINKIIAYKARKDVLKKLTQQGMGRHSAAEITEIGNQDFLALANFLGDKPYFFGSQVSSLDIVAYSMLVQFLKVPQFSAPIFDIAQTYHNLNAFTERFHAQVFSD